MKKLFITPVKLRNGNFPKIIDGADSYGFGMFLNTTPQGVIAWHSGIWRGFRAYIGRKIDHNILMVVFDNTIGNDNNAHYVELNSAFEKL